jgi:hypothetical protein
MWMVRQETHEYILVLFDHLHNTSWWYTSALFAIILWTTRWVVRSLLFAGNFTKIWVNYFLDDCNIGYIIKSFKRTLWLWAERFNALDVVAELTTKPFINIIYICIKKHNNSLIECANSWCWWHHSLHHKRMARLSVDVRKKHLICGSRAPIMWAAGPCIIASRFHSPARAMSARAWLITGCLGLRVSEYFRLALMTPVPTREHLIYFLFLQLFLQVRTCNLQCFFFLCDFKKKTENIQGGSQECKEERKMLAIH